MSSRGSSQMREGSRRLREPGNATSARARNGGRGGSCAVMMEEWSESHRKQQLQKQTLLWGLQGERHGPANTAISTQGHPVWASVLRNGEVINHVLS